MESTKKALIFQGGWDGHEPALVAQRFGRMLEKHGYACEIYDSQDVLADAEKLMGMDVIVPCWTMGEIKPEYTKNISRAVAAGTGLAGCHGGMCDAFRQDVEWQFMTGGQWVSHPGGDGTDYTVNIHKGSSPIVAGMEDFHVCSEKPLAATYEEGAELAALAAERGLLLGGAPDTFLGAGIQTCRRLIDDGMIGDVIGAEAKMVCHGHESWHPAPEFYYQYGGGPMMDMGPYYMTALVNLIGRVQSISGMTGTAFPQRIITSKPKQGTVVDVEVPTHTTGLMKFQNGAIATVVTTFDVYYDRQAFLEIYGTRGTLRVPDPNGFGGSVSLLRPEDGSFKEMPLLYDYKENSRGLGVADMAKALREGRAPRADAQQTLHVLEILTAFEKSSREGRCVELASPYRRREAMRNMPVSGILD